MTSADYLHTAFLLAKRANSKDIRPNPFVGAIVVDHNGEIIGEGYHQKAGEAHAEVLAINNALLNIDSTLSVPNQILQGNFSEAAVSISRFAINSTVGILGLFDPATALGIEKTNREDFGQTLAVWGVDHGCYAVAPFLGPTSPRDLVGRIVGVYGDYFYMITAGDKTAFGENLGDTVYWATEGTDVVNFRSQNIKSSENLEKNSLDLYSAYKSLYLQRRENLVKNVKRSENQYGASEDEWKKIR